MNGIGAGSLRGLDDLVAAEIALGRWRRSNEYRLVGFAHVRSAHIGFAVHRHRLDAELVAGANDAQGDLATVRNQNFSEHVLPKAECCRASWADSCPACSEATRERRRARAGCRADR